MSDRHGVFLRSPAGTDPRRALHAVMDEFMRTDPLGDGQGLAPLPPPQRICVLPGDMAGSGHLRAAWPAQLMAAVGMDVKVFPPGTLTAWKQSNTNILGTVRSRLLEPPPFDVVIIQRPTSYLWPTTIMALREAGVRVVIDWDDDPMALSPDHPAWQKVNPKYSPMDNYVHAKAAMGMADAVVVSTPALQNRYGGTVVRNAIPASYLVEPRTAVNVPLQVGWPGAVWNHPGDLDVTRGGVALAIEKCDAGFVNLGDSTGVAEALRLKRPLTAIGHVPIAEYPAIVAQWDVGIAPLADTLFNRSKSYLKPLEYAALGVPFVCSDLPEYRLFVEQGCGYLAERARDWETIVKMLLQSPARREMQANIGRKIAAEHTLETRWPLFAAAWLGTVAASSMVKA